MHLIQLLAVLVFLAGCSQNQSKTEWPEPMPVLKDLPNPSVDNTKETVKTEPVPKVLTLNHALLFVLTKNPELATFSWGIKASEARILQASLWNNPQLAIEIEEFAGQDDLQAFDAAEITIQFSQQVQLGGQISKQTKVASLRRDLAVWNYEENRLKVFSTTAKAFVAVLAAQERKKLAKDLLELANKIHETTKRRVDSGKVSPIEQTRTAALVTSSEIEWEKAKRSLQIAKQNLSSLWGEFNPKFQEVYGDFYKTNPLPSLVDLEKRISQNPKIARIKKDIERSRAVVSLEESKKIPDVNFGLGVRFFTETDDQALVAGVSLPLPIFDRNQGNIQDAKYKVEQTIKNGQSVKLQLRASLIEAYQNLSISLIEIDKLEKKVLANTKAVLDATRQGYKQGKFSYLEMLDAQRIFFGAKSQYIQALASYHGGVVEIEGLIADRIDFDSRR